jgi:hypothetical protein
VYSKTILRITTGPRIRSGQNYIVLQICKTDRFIIDSCRQDEWLDTSPYNAIVRETKFKIPKAKSRIGEHGRTRIILCTRTLTSNFFPPSVIYNVKPECTRILYFDRKRVFFFIVLNIQIFFVEFLFFRRKFP